METSHKNLQCRQGSQGLAKEKVGSFKCEKEFSCKKLEEIQRGGPGLDIEEKKLRAELGDIERSPKRWCGVKGLGRFGLRREMSTQFFFFHTATLVRRKRNYIGGIKDDNRS